MPKLALLPIALCLAVASTACDSSGGGLRLDGSSAPAESSGPSTSQGAEGCVYSRDSSNSQALTAECRAAAAPVMPAGCSAQMEYSSRSPECQTGIANAAAAEARRNLAK